MWPLTREAPENRSTSHYSVLGVYFLLPIPPQPLRFSFMCLNLSQSVCLDKNSCLDNLCE